MILGMKVRKHDIIDMLKFNPHVLEFHFSDEIIKNNFKYQELGGKFIIPIPEPRIV